MNVWRQLALCGLLWWGATALPTQTQTSASAETALLTAICALPNDQVATLPALLRDQPQAVTVKLWQSLVERGEAARDVRDFPRAHFFFAAAKHVAQHLSDRLREGLALYQTGLTHTYEWQLEAAIKVYLDSRKMLQTANASEHLVYVLADLGALYYYQHAYQPAKDYSLESLARAAQAPATAPSERARPDGEAAARANLGAVARWEGDYEQALAYLRQALRQYQALAHNNSDFQAQVAAMQAEIGRVYRVLGDYPQALAYLNQGLAWARTMSEPGFQADMLHSIGIVYLEQRDYPQAAVFVRQSLALHRVAKDERQIAQGLLNLGVLEYRQANYEAALTALREGRAICERIGFQDGLLATSAALGTVLRLQGKLPEARQWLAQSLALAEQAQDPTRRAEVLWQLAETELAAGQGQAAQAAAQRALTLAQRHRLPNLAYLAATALGKTWWQQEDTTQAATCFIQAIQSIEAARAQVAGTEQEAVTFFADKVEPYQQMVALLVAQNQPAEALLYAERAKGRVLRDVMRSGPASFEPGLTPEERAKLQQLRRTLAQLNQQPPSESQTAQLAAARLAYESYRNDLWVAHPELRRRQGETDTLRSILLQLVDSSELVNVNLCYATMLDIASAQVKKYLSERAATLSPWSI